MARPSYAELPIAPHYPPRSAWGVFGDDDELGTLNLVGAAELQRAATLIRKATVFPLNWDIELPSPALFGRKVLKHRILDIDPVGTEDVYDDFYPQASSQWDALAHIKHPEYGFYNGRTRADITGKPGGRLGVDHWARRGIAGRFVLADVARYLATNGEAFRPDDSYAVGVPDLETCLQWEGVRLSKGDILLIRFGWVRWYEDANESTREAIASTDLFSAAGLDRSEAMAAWLWDAGVAAVAADNPALEVQPFDESTENGYLHYRLIPLLGMAIGELFDLESLASDCAADRVFEGMLVAAPLNKVGGSGSPANAIAIK